MGQVEMQPNKPTRACLRVKKIKRFFDADLLAQVVSAKVKAANEPVGVCTVGVGSNVGVTERNLFFCHSNFITDAREWLMTMAQSKRCLSLIFHVIEILMTLEFRTLCVQD